jgi:hypothetical protein
MGWLLVLLLGTIPYVNSKIADGYIGYRVVSRPAEELENGKWVQKYYIYDILEKHPTKGGVYKAVFFTTSEHPLKLGFGKETYVTTLDANRVWQMRVLGDSFHKMGK